MRDTIVVMDLETVPDYEAVGRLHSLQAGDKEGAKAALGEKFPKCLWHRIICIGTLVANKSDGYWEINSIDASHIGSKTEDQLIADFAYQIGELRRPHIITFNGNAFDLPVLRYRAMLNRIPAPSLSTRAYFHRYTNDAIDVCDVLSSFGSSTKASLQEISRSLGLPGKADGMKGSEVESLFEAGRVTDVAEYCRGDVINTYHIWLTHELFCGRLSKEGYSQSCVMLDRISENTGLNLMSVPLSRPSASTQAV